MLIIKNGDQDAWGKGRSLSETATTQITHHFRSRILAAEGKVSHLVYHNYTSLTDKHFLRFELADKKLSILIQNHSLLPQFPEALYFLVIVKKKIFQHE